VDAQLPRIAECLDLLWLTSDIFTPAVLHISLASAHLPVGPKLG
jgi:hypothetical protein